jgi:hypothetical protein
LRHYATSRKVAGSIAEEVIEFLPFTYALGPGIHSASNINEYQKQKKILLESSVVISNNKNKIEEVA